MRRTELLRSSAFRLAAVICGLVLLAFLISGAVSFRLMVRETDELQDLRLRLVGDVLRAELAKRGPGGMREVAGHLSTPGIANATVIGVFDPSGVLVAGDRLPFTPPEGLSDQAATIGGVLHAMRALRFPLGADTVVVALDAAPARRAERSILWAMGWGGIGALIVALGGGTLVARRVLTRHRQVADAMRRIGDGDLAARIPLSPARDDIDDLAIGMNDALERLSALVEGMRQVSADISHDLRTPLARVRVRLLGAIDAIPDSHPAHAEVTGAIADCEALTKTFTALLRITQIEAHTRRAAFGPVDLGDLVADLAETYAVMAEDAGDVLTVELPQRPVRVQGDHDLLVQATVNLIENAIRHGPPGVRIACAVRQDRGVATLEVRDDGPGIPEAERPLVLRRLYRREASRSTSGSGLGLTLVKAVADLHSARLELADAHPGLVVRMVFGEPRG